MVALSVLDDLWLRRNERRPVLLVIDEAHNLCSPDLAGPLLTAVRERIIQIAAEGRKYGLWLLLSTQRPSKIHPGIISQCDNLALMKMSSQGDLDELAKVFGFAPPSLLSLATQFHQGEALLAGGFASVATSVRVRRRLTHEGGRDVSRAPASMISRSPSLRPPTTGPRRAGRSRNRQSKCRRRSERWKCRQVPGGCPPLRRRVEVPRRTASSYWEDVGASSGVN